MINLKDMSVSELQKLIADAKAILDKALEEQRQRDQKARRAKSANASLRKRELEKAGVEMFYERVKVGSIVRVDGVRNLAYKYREVTEVGRGQFTGRQVKFDRDGNVIYGTEYTTHMANKIREIRQ